MLKKFIEWIKSLLRRTQFDNKLFKVGITRVKRIVKAQLKSVDGITIDGLFEHIIKAMLEEFGHIKVVNKQLNNAMEFVHGLIKKDFLVWEETIIKKVDFIGDKLIEYYDTHY